MFLELSRELFVSVVQEDIGWIAKAPARILDGGRKNLYAPKEVADDIG